MSTAELIERYLSGAAELRAAVRGMTDEQLRAAPVPGKWSTQQVVCHIADFEPIYADRMKRVLAEQEPRLLSGDPDLFAARLAYPERNVEEELHIIDYVRRQMGRILKTASPLDFQRKGIHSEAGALTLETLLTRVTNHIPHHIAFILEKRKALGL